MHFEFSNRTRRLYRQQEIYQITEVERLIHVITHTHKSFADLMSIKPGEGGGGYENCLSYGRSTYTETDVNNK